MEQTTQGVAEPRTHGGSSPAVAIALALLLALAFVRPLLYGASPPHVVLAWGHHALYIVLPGWLAWRVLRPERDDLVAELALGWCLGHVLQMAAFLGLRAMDSVQLYVAWPLVAVPLFLLLGRVRRGAVSPPAARAPALEPRIALGLAAVLAVAIVRSRLLPATGWWTGFDLDRLFHAGNAVSVGRALPLEDARIAELPQNYHYYSYAIDAGLRAVTGIPIVESMERLLPACGPVLLTLLVFVVTRSFCAGGDARRPARAGLIAAALVMFHADLGFNLVRVFGTRALDIELQTYLEYGIYQSPSMVLGLGFLAVLAHLARSALRSDGPPPLRTWVLVALFSAAAAGTKGTVIPIAVSASALVLLVACVKRERAGRALAVFLATILPALPMTLALALGEGSHASAMFRFGPWDAFSSSGAFRSLAGLFGWSASEAPLWLDWVFGWPWLVLFFGPAGIAAAGELIARRRAIDPGRLWLLGAAVAATGAGMALASPGVSQLFFVYGGQVALAVLAGLFLAAGAGRRWLAAVLVFAAAPALGALLDCASQARHDVLAKLEESSLRSSYRSGLEWIRDHTPVDAVILYGATEMLASVHAERRAFFETARATPRAYEHGWRREHGRWVDGCDQERAFPERSALRDRFAKRPDADAIEAARNELHGGAPLYAIVDSLRLVHPAQGGSYWEVGAVEDRAIADPRVELVMENAAMRIYRWVGRGREGSR